jgi:hypothetical protein
MATTKAIKPAANRLLEFIEFIGFVGFIGFIEFVGFLGSIRLLELIGFLLLRNIDDQFERISRRVRMP